MHDTITTILREAGADLLRMRREFDRSQLHFKKEADLVTEADKAIENQLRHHLAKAFPTFGFRGEEGGDSGNDDRYFLVDPIDGTTSFVHGIPYYAISLAVKQHGETSHGFVFAPALDAFYSAEKGGGAFRNGTPLRVSDTREPINALAATGFACVRGRVEPTNVPVFARIIPQIRGIRRFGSAAIDLCLVAEGTLDLYWEMNIRAWDIAAGVRVLREAGGTVTDFDGGDSCEVGGRILGTNGHLHTHLLSEIRAALVP